MEIKHSFHANIPIVGGDDHPIENVVAGNKNGETKHREKKLDGLTFNNGGALSKTRLHELI